MAASSASSSCRHSVVAGPDGGDADDDIPISRMNEQCKLLLSCM